ncbi:thioredoxin family protein [Herbiconiux sp. P15]|uniref:thioredoxin family protein n=1 Tax=Herbiconiux liukaitaii TaxID=3342799 RepID=UPI0035B8049D
MATVDITEANLSEVIDAGGIVFLDFWAEWCAPCRVFAPIYSAASDSNPDIVFGKVNIEVATTLASSAGIQAVPTLMAFRDSTIVFSQGGALPKPALADLINEVRALDMDAFRAEASAHPEGHGHTHL